MAFNTPLRYPGGKGRLTNFIKLIFEKNNLLDGHYIEPYAGGAGIALNLLLLEYASCIHLNDLNSSVHAFWHSVLNAPDDLCRAIRDVDITMEEWRKQKSIQSDPDNHTKLELGFSTFFLNRTNRSGIILGGTIGGKNQDGPWKMDARFNKNDLCRRIEKIALYRSRIRLYNLDAAELIANVLPSLPEKTLIYLDPPYYVKGEGLYENHYVHDDHAKIAKLICEIKNKWWIVSYDNAPQICELYKNYYQISYGLKYSVKKRYTGSEVMFFSPDLKVPEVKNPAELKAA